MRRLLPAVFALILVLALAVLDSGLFASSVSAQAPAPTAKPCDSHCGHWMDANLRLDQLQMVGTAESYKQRPDAAVMGLIRMGGRRDAEALDYGQPLLAAQLDNDVRALSFDVAYDPQGGLYKNPAAASMAMDLLPDDYVAAMRKPGFKVLHVFDVDYRSSCLSLAVCLGEVAAWSRAHPRHLPIVISLHTNDARTPMPGAIHPLACDAAALDALDGEIRAVFQPGEILTPDQMQGAFPSLRAAALAHAWSTLGAARGKVIFVLDDTAEKIRAYQGGRASLEGRAMFVAGSEATPLTAFLALPDPLESRARIAAAVQAGFIVITRADSDTREARANQTARRDAAFASGAQIVETDFAAADQSIGAYRVSLGDDPRALCGPMLAPEHCVRFETPPPASLAALP